MKIEWGAIREQMLRYAKHAYSEQHIILSDNNIKQCLIVFKNILSINSGYGFLDGSYDTIMSALQDACVDKVGDISSLRTLVTGYEGFLKKSLILSNRKSYHEIEGKMLMPVFKSSMIMPNFSRSNPTINDSTLNTFYYNTEGLYFFADVYLARNKVHVLPDWDASNVTEILKSFVALVVLSISQLMPDLKLHYPDLLKDNYSYFGESEYNRFLADLFSYGDTATKLKEHMIVSYIEYNLYSKGKIQEAELIDLIHSFTGNRIDDGYIKSKINNLCQSGKLLKDDTCNYVLSEGEKQIQERNRVSYFEADTRFKDSLSSLLKKYSISASRLDDVINILGKFFEQNFKFDIDEAINNITDSNISDEVSNLIQELLNLGCPQGQDLNLFREILQICKSNDIFVRVCLGRVFSKVTNPESFQNFARLNDKVVYLDTQVVLYILCVTSGYKPWDNPFYKLAKRVVDLALHKENLHFYFADCYVSEVAYHITQAYELVNFLDIPKLRNIRLSNNVFFSYFFYLRRNAMLPDPDMSFGDFLDSMFQLTEDDIYDPEFKEIVNGAIEPLLDDCNIEICFLPNYNNNDITRSLDLYKSSITHHHLPDKATKSLSNDSIMGLHLFNSKYEKHLTEPFFLSWDKTFTYYRSDYVAKFKRGSSLSWHLFTPGKFVNSTDLINMRIDMDSLTDDFLASVENSKFAPRTKNLVDIVNKFLNTKNVSSDARKRYIRYICKDIFSQEEFSESVDLDKTTDTKAETFARLLDQLINYYRVLGKEIYNFYNASLTKEDNVIKILQEAKRYAEISNTFNTQDFINSVNHIIGLDQKEKILTKKISDNE